jgi:catechol 2,3-dioxygenase-like lactoylglutathione lyase family enzyme
LITGEGYYAAHNTSSGWFGPGCPWRRAADGSRLPDRSIEVDDLDGALARVREAGLPIEYGPAEEPWGVRRSFVRDPFGKLINILVHAPR